MYWIIALLSILSLLPASMAGLKRYKNIPPDHKPFIIYIWVGFINELVSAICSYTIRSTVVNNNIFMLLESLLLLWQFALWQKLRVRKPVLFFSAAVLILAWGTEMLYKEAGYYIFYFSMFYSCIIVLWASHLMARQVVWHKQAIFKEATFVIYCGLICYFSLRIFVEACWFYGLDKSPFFRNNIFIVLAGVNVVVNLLYAYAILWMPKKPGYITVY